MSVIPVEAAGFADAAAFGPAVWGACTMHYTHPSLRSPRCPRCGALEAQ